MHSKGGESRPLLNVVKKHLGFPPSIVGSSPTPSAAAATGADTTAGSMAASWERTFLAKAFGARAFAGAGAGRFLGFPSPPEVDEEAPFAAT